MAGETEYRSTTSGDPDIVMAIQKRRAAQMARTVCDKSNTLKLSARAAYRLRYDYRNNVDDRYRDRIRGELTAGSTARCEGNSTN